MTVHMQLATPPSTPPRHSNPSSPVSAPNTPPFPMNDVEGTDARVAPLTEVLTAMNQRMEELQQEADAARQAKAPLTIEIAQRNITIQNLQTTNAALVNTNQQLTAQAAIDQQQLATAAQQVTTAAVETLTAQTQLRQQVERADTQQQLANTAAAANAAEIAKRVEAEQELLRTQQEHLRREYFAECLRIIQEFQQPILAKMKDAFYNAGSVGLYSGISGALVGAVGTKDVKGTGTGCLVGSFSGVATKAMATLVGSQWNFRVKNLTIAQQIYKASEFCRVKKIAWDPARGFPEAGKEVFQIVSTFYLWKGNSEEALWMQEALQGREPKVKPLPQLNMDRGLEQTDTAAATQTAAQPSSPTTATTDTAATSTSWAIFAPVGWIKSALSWQ